MTFADLRIGARFRWTLDGDPCWKVSATEYANERATFRIRTAAFLKRTVVEG